MNFPQGSVPVKIVARIYGKDPCWVRAGIISGLLPIGYATRHGKPITIEEYRKARKGRCNFYVSPKMLYEHTGYLWNGERDG